MKIEVGLKYKILNGPKNIGIVYEIRNSCVYVYFDSNPNDTGSSSLNNFIKKIEKGELIVINDEFKLPEKWCIKPKDEEEAELIFSFEGISKHQDSKNIIHYQHYPPYKILKGQPQENCTACPLIQFGYTEITIEQFKKYVLNTDIETIDYSYLISFIKQLET
jgi:hypothetical protein